jgi:hypothetical protein
MKPFVKFDTKLGEIAFNKSHIVSVHHSPKGTNGLVEGEPEIKIVTDDERILVLDKRYTFERVMTMLNE